MTNAWDAVVQTFPPEAQGEVVEQAAAIIGNLSLDEVRNRAALLARAQNAVRTVLTQRGWSAAPDLVHAMAQQVAARIGGLGFLDPWLKPGEVSEVAITPYGQLWVLRKGAPDFELVQDNLDLEQTWRAVDALLAPLGRAVNEANPSVDAGLPRSETLPGGARIKVLHPVIAPGKGYPSVNIRLYEPRPVPPSLLVSWKVAPEAVIQGLVEAVGRGLRVLVIGGTATGKTTLLAALANGIPKTKRVVKIEDPEEIWLDHPHVVTIQARPSPPGSDVPAYTLADGVDDAMRMSPKWLIVGEIRTGDAALALFRAQMSDHPGLSTFHAEGPKEAVHRMGVIMFTDRGVRFEAAKSMFAQAIDLVVQVGWAEDEEGQRRRRIIGVWEVAQRELSGGNVKFRRLYTNGDAALETISVTRTVA